MPQEAVLSPNPVVVTGLPAHRTPVSVAPAVDNLGNEAKLVVSASGQLLVQVSGAGSGGTSSVDGANFVVGVSAGTPIMAEDPTSGHLLILQTVAGTRSLQAIAAPVTSNTCSANAPAAIGTTSSAAIAANANRKRLVLQNAGTTVLYVLYGAGTASAANFTFALPAGGSTKDGTSAIQNDVMWTGAVQWASSSAGGIGVANELT